MKTKIPFVDLKTQYDSIAEELNEVIREVINTSAFIGGKYTERFEKNFARYCGSKYCLGVGNGTDALFVALRGMGIGSGDEVIAPANSFIATSEAISLTGAKPVFVDCDRSSYNIDADLIEEKISPATRALIPVHLYGQPADMKAVVEIADRHDLEIIQDSAQAHGAEIDGRPLSSFGGVLCFSFYPGKNLGAYGDAGGIVTDDLELFKRAKQFANHGRSSKHYHQVEGINSRMDGLQGAILDVKLKYLSAWTEQRIKHADLYSLLLRGVGDIICPQTTKNFKHVFHLYVIRTKFRDQLRDFLVENNIACGVHYPVALPNLEAYKHLGFRPEDYPAASEYQDHILSLPIYPEMTPEIIESVVDRIKTFFAAGS